MARDLEWVVLRPSVVVGRQAYGGSALFRGLAALPAAAARAGYGADAGRAARRPRAHGGVLPARRCANPRRSRDRRARGAVARGGARRVSAVARLRRAALRVGAALGGACRVPDRRPHRPSRLAPAAQIHHAGRDRTRRDRRSGRLAAPHRHRAAHARRRACRRARVRAGALVRAALFPQARGAGHAIVVLDRDGTRGLGSGVGGGSAPRSVCDVHCRRPAGRGRRDRRSADRSRHRDPAHGEDRRSSQAWRCPSAILGSPRCCCRDCGADPLGSLVKVLPIIVLHLVALAILDER